MNPFELLLEIKTNKTDLQLKAVYVPNCRTSWKLWAYYIYYYDVIEHTFYINGLDTCAKNRKSPVECIESIMNKAFRQEMNSFVDLLKRIQKTKRPKVYCFHVKKPSKEILIDNIYLETKRWKNDEIISFKKPSWRYK